MASNKITYKEISNELLEKINKIDQFDNKLESMLYAIEVLKNNIPKKMSQLENDEKFIKADDEVIKSKAPLDNPSFTGTLNINNINILDIIKKNTPTKLSQLKNDEKFIKKDIIEKRALKPLPGYNNKISDINPYQFTIEGSSNKAAGITFDRGKYRINFGIDNDNKLKIGGGILEDNAFEIVNSDNILNILTERGLFLTAINPSGKLIMMNAENVYEIVYDEKLKTITLKSIGGN